MLSRTLSFAVASFVAVALLVAARSPSTQLAAQRGIRPAPSLESLTISIVDGATRAPVAGAVVHALELERPRGSRARTPPWEPLDLDALERRGTRFVADARGEVRVPRTVGGLSVSAEHEGKYGLCSVTLDGPELRRLIVPLEPDRGLCVRVLDVEGRPEAGVTVELRALVTSHEPAADLVRATTDADGRALLRHAGAFVSRHRRQVLLVRPVGSFAPDLFVEVTEASLGTEVELHLPATGAVELTVLDAQSRALQTPRSVALRVVGSPNGGRARLSPIWEALPGECEGTVVRFTRVALGLTLEASAALPDSPFGTLLACIDGPRVAGKTAVATLGGSSWCFGVSGRCVDADGAPLVIDAVELECATKCGSGAARGSIRVRADEHAGFRFALPSHCAQRTSRTFGVIALLGDAVVGIGRVQVGADVNGVLLELGDVVCTERAESVASPSTSDVSNVLTLAGSDVGRIAGSVRFGPDFRAQDFLVFLHDVGDRSNPRYTELVADVDRRRGTFVFEGLASAEYSLEVRLGRSRKLLEVAGLSPERDIRVENTRLELDVSDRIHAFEIDVLDENGAPIADAWLTLQSSAGVTERRSANARQGRARFLDERARLDIVAHAPDHVPELGSVSSGKHTFRLRHGLDLEFELVQPELPPNILVRVHLEGGECPTHLPESSRERRFVSEARPSLSSKVVVHAPGDYTAIVAYVDDLGEGFETIVWTVRQPIVVSDGEPWRFRLEPDPGVVALLEARYARRR
ncbi:MAG: hydroxyisourate hydrolase [Planctomycetes bacterium]|nr:hydroxyisourate hydrolase [Planctomycetota bacterium]